MFAQSEEIKCNITSALNNKKGADTSYSFFNSKYYYIYKDNRMLLLTFA